MSRTDRARSIRIGKNLWFNHRGIYEKRRRFGEEELKKKKTLKEEIFEGNDFMERQQEYEWVLGLHEIIGKENKSMIKRQLTEAWKASMDAGKQHIKELKQRMYDLFPRLFERKGYKAGTLSGGEQQRVCIARAIVNEPKLLLCDEPTGNLDPKVSKEIMDVIDNINKELGTTVVMATHDKDIVNRMKKRVVTIENGLKVSDKLKGSYKVHESN